MTMITKEHKEALDHRKQMLEDIDGLHHWDSKVRALEEAWQRGFDYAKKSGD